MTIDRCWQVLIVGTACVLMACAHEIRKTQYHNLELRLVSENGGQAFPQWGEPGTMPLESNILFSGKDFSAIRTNHGGDDKKTPSLELDFTKDASSRFEQLTTRRSGRRLAIVIDGKVVIAPKILHPITTGLFEITGPSEKDIREMYRLINVLGH